jgi:catechol 2,3-dioxygenase-like lactoylglutathione lyase family enzyme
MHGIDHVGVSCEHLDRSLEFYRDLLGLRVLDRGVERSADMATLLGHDNIVFEYADLDAGDGRVVELVSYRSPVADQLPGLAYRPGTAHIALRVEDVAGLGERLTAAGVDVLSRAPVRLSDPGSFWDGAICLLVRDPDGALVELVERP